MAAACSAEVQDSPTSNGCSASQTKTDNGKKWHWNCAAALCTNNWRTKDLTYYTLAKIGSSKDAALRASYMKVLKNDNINWRKAVICSQHWSKGKRESLFDPPDRVCSVQYVQNLEKSTQMCAALKRKKLVAAKRSLKSSSSEVKAKRRIIVRQEREENKKKPPTVCQGYKPEECEDKLENEKIRNQVEELARKLQEKEAEMESLKSQVQYLLEKEKIQESKIFEMERGQFNYMILKDKQNKFLDLTGLTTYEFDCLYECVEPFTHLIRYPDCKGGGFETKTRKVDAKTELMIFSQFVDTRCT